MPGGECEAFGEQLNVIQRFKLISKIRLDSSSVSPAGQNRRALADE